MNRKYADIILSRILSLCELRGITINKLADMSGIRQSTLHNLVCGASVNPTMRTMHKIAIAFNMTLAEFLDFCSATRFLRNRDRIVEKNSPILRSISEARSLASTAPQQGERPTQEGGLF